MPTDILKLWPEDSDSTVVRGKGLVQLGHLAADTRELFDQMDLKPHVPQIKGSLHTGYPAANDQYIFVHDNLPSLHKIVQRFYPPFIALTTSSVRSLIFISIPSMKLAAQLKCILHLGHAVIKVSAPVAMASFNLLP